MLGRSWERASHLLSVPEVCQWHRRHTCWLDEVLLQLFLLVDQCRLPPMTDCGAVRVPHVDMRECSGERIRRDRAAPLSPRLALRRVLLLAEGRQFREAAAVLARLGPTGLAVVASELPLDILVESLPHSAQLLETLFCK